MRGQVKPPLPVIGIDILGSDTAAHELLNAVLLFAAQNGKLARFVIFGKSEDFKDCPPLPHVEYFEVASVIAMEEDPIKALKAKPDSSIAVGICQLKEKKIDAFISFGNTGALLACATLSLNLLSNVARPALLATLPTEKKPLAVLDVGANVSVSAKQLVDFAKIGIAYQQSLGYSSLRFGLLNIGTEPSKGTATLKEAYEKLLSLDIKGASFIGNVEAREAFKGEVDVLVTDGFSGNIFLKTAEGLGEMVLKELQGIACQEEEKLSILKEKLTYNKYPGALFAGLDGIVIKCHGVAHPSALVSSIEKAISLTNQNFLSHLSKRLESE